MTTKRSAESPGGKSPATDPIDDLLEAVHLSLEASPDSSAALRILVEKLQARAAHEAFTPLRDFTNAIAGNFDIAVLVRQILDQAIEVARAERGVLFLSNAKDGRLAPAVARSVTGDELDQLGSISRTILAEAREGGAVIARDALHDSRFQDVPSVQIKRVHTVICLPLRVGDQMIGLLYLDAGHGSEAFAERSLGTLEALAGVAAAAIENARLHGRLLSENQRLRQQLEQGDAFSAITTVDSGMTSLLRRAMLMAQTDVSIMILGETGTGKELLARAIHQASPRAGKPFVAQNCAAMPQQLVDALIFGHERGVFTGAHCSRAGFFELANGGTLFLDEVGELDAGQQAKLLRVVEDGIVRRLGAARERRVDVRIISATSRDIHQAVRAGGFREELAYRLGVLELRIAPLRERRADIPILAQHFVQKHAPTDAHRTRTLFTREALEFLQTLHWAGNVRALENLVRRALVLCEPGPIDVLDIRSLLPELNEVQPGRSPVRAGTPRLSPGIARDPAFDLRVGEIREALQRTSGNQSRAAALLGCHRNTLRRWIQEFGIGTQK